jgi:hypothetical protein
MEQGNAMFMSEEAGQPSLVDDYANEGFYIQNMMPGPLFINDKRSNLVNAMGMPAGLRILLEGHEVGDLSGEDPNMLRRSPALRQAIRENYVVILTYQEYLGALEKNERSKRVEERERRKRLIEIDGELVEAEDINLATGEARGSAAVDTSQLINNPATYAKMAAAARQQGIDSYEFQKMVESGDIQGGMASARFGRRISLDELPEAPSQIEMTRSRATVTQAPMGDGTRTSTAQMRMENFNTTGRLAGYDGQIADNPVSRQSQAQPTRQVQQQRVIRGGGSQEDAVVEDVDLAMDDGSWDAMQDARSGEVAPMMGARSISRAR